MKLTDFFDADKHQSFLTVDFNTFSIKAFYNVMGMIMKTWRTWWWEWSSILKVLKVTSCNVFTISLKRSYEWSSQFLIKLLIFDDSSQTCPKYQKRKFDKFYQYIKKKYCNCFCVLLWCGTFRYFTGFQPCLLLHFFGWLWSKMGVVF